MKILITGSNGFIGKRLVEKLAKFKKYKILNLVRLKKEKIKNKKVEYFKCDLNIIESYKKKVLHFKPDTLIHLAWDKIPNFSYINSKNNEKLSVNLINYLTKNTQIKNIIVAGSCFELRVPNKSYLNFKNSKLKILNYLKSICKINKINYQWLRIFYAFGPNQRKDSLIPALISAKNKTKINIHNLNYGHDYIYVDDICDCIIKCLKPNIGSNIFEVGTGKIIKIKVILKIIEKLKSIKIIVNKKNKNTNHQLKANTKLVQKKINWHPNISFERGIKKILKSKEIL